MLPECVWSAFLAQLDLLREDFAQSSDDTVKQPSKDRFVDACFWLSSAHALHSLILHSIGRLTLKRKGKLRTIFNSWTTVHA